MNRNNIETEEYLTVKELSNRIKYDIQSLYNLIYRGIFVLGIHYLKPSSKKILFKWSAIKQWIGDTSHNQNQDLNASFDNQLFSNDHNKNGKHPKRGSIKI